MYEEDWRISGFVYCQEYFSILRCILQAAAVFCVAGGLGGGYARGTPGLFYKSQQSPRIPIKVPHTAQMGKYREYMEGLALTFIKKM